MAAQLLFNNADTELEEDEMSEDNFEFDLDGTELEMTELHNARRNPEEAADGTNEVEKEKQNELAKRYFEKDIDSLKPKQQQLVKLKYELERLDEILNKTVPSPFESIFLTHGMNNKLDDVYQDFSNDMVKLALDTDHKPVFWDLSPEHRLSFNGKFQKQYIPNEDGTLKEEDQKEYNAYVEEQDK